MSQQLINLGSVANDGTGSPLRTGGQDINANFTELYAGMFPVFNVRTYGAKGDGVTDDTAALQAAITAAAAGGIIYFGPGTYKCTGLTITTEPIIIGAGPATILALTGAISYNSPGATLSAQSQGLMVRDMTISPSSGAAGQFIVDVVAGVIRLSNIAITNQLAAVASGWAGAVRLQDTNYAVLDNVAVVGSDGDLWPIGCDLCPSVSVNRGNITILGSIVNRATTAVRIAHSATGVVNNVQLLGTKLLYNGSGAAVGGTGVLASSCRNLVLVGVHAESFDVSYDLTSVLSGQITGCRAVNFGTPGGGATQVGLYLRTACKELSISGNEFDSGGSTVGTGIVLDATGNADILIGPNRYANVATAITDGGTGGGRAALPDPAGTNGFWFKDHVSVNWLSVLQGNVTLANGNNNDYSPSFYGNLGLMADVGGSAITGLAAGVSGKRLTLTYRGGGVLTMLHQSASSSAGNRIITPTATTLTISGGAELLYDGSSSRWRIVSYS